MLDTHVIKRSGKPRFQVFTSSLANRCGSILFQGASVPTIVFRGEVEFGGSAESIFEGRWAGDRGGVSIKKRSNSIRRFDETPAQQAGLTGLVLPGKLHLTPEDQGGSYVCPSPGLRLLRYARE